MKKLILLLGCAFLLTACTKSNIVSPEGLMEPDLTIKEGIEIDWDQIQGDLDDEMLDQDLYPISETVSFSVDESTQTVNLTAVVKDSATSEEAVKYADQLIKTFNDDVTIQDFSYSKSTETSYGKFFQKYAVQIQVIPASAKEDPSAALVDQLIKAGEDTPVAAKSK